MTTIDDVYDSEAEQEQLDVIVERRYISMLGAIHALVGDALGLDPVSAFRLDDEATRLVLEHAAERVVRIDSTTREAIREHLQRGQELGLSNWEIANGSPKDDFPPLDRLFQETWKGRAELIARTELAESQRVSALNRYAASGLVDHVRVVDGDYDAFCASRNGQVVTLANAPGLAHPACLTPGQQVVAPNCRAASAREFEGEVVVLRTAANDLLTCTPNHPILTDSGWVAAQFIREGDNVIRCVDAQRIATLIAPDDDYRPVPIEQVADSFGPSFGGISATVPLTSEDFHGDAADGQVGVVWTDGRRQRCGTTEAGQHGVEPPVERTDVALESHLSGGSVAKVVPGFSAPTDGFMGCGGKSFAAFAGHFAVAQVHALATRSRGPASPAPRLEQIRNIGPDFSGESGTGLPREVSVIESAVFRGVPLRFSLGVVPQCEPFAVQGFAQRFGVPADDTSHILKTLAGLVETVCVTQVSHRQFSGHVYNLETDQGWYVAQNIITHNCRLVVIPIVREVPV